ncbi:molybdopterin synthase, small subunit [Sterolibacterium denitrificans]|uniref:Molybdopterin synthase sulfur carrier subunit n=1 Tax=Sterolibacterium denitrificans TaxID=157592 RepID=A0A7Z7MW54_9PROT|nr:molybdopterin converting factor subunit 1 [Sterolibacterium denitrificans]SMB28410.1 molybdopterin synthase, small subunit [Sterolibacterium denitrificans]
MALKILYFASLREALDSSGEELALPAGVTSLAALREHLAGRGGVWRKLVESQSLRAAVNQKMADAEAAIADGDEIAFFPPVTGG